MKVTNIESQTVKTYILTVEGGEVCDQEYTAGRRYRVKRITVVKQDGNVRSVELRGPVLKKDGTDSLNEGHDKFFFQRGWPSWLHGVIGGLA